MTLYFDPLLDVHHRVPVSSAMGNQFFLSPLVPEDSRTIFDAGMASLGFLDEEVGPDRVMETRSAAGAWFLSKEFGLTEVADHLGAAIDGAQQPTWDTERGEFTWGCNLDEPHPRGQFNAWLAAAEANSPGAWTRLATERLPEGEPLVEGVDFASVALSEARWVDSELKLALVPRNDTIQGTTSFRVTGLDDPGAWTASGAGATSEAAGDELVVTAPIGRHELVVRRGSA